MHGQRQTTAFPAPASAPPVRRPVSVRPMRPSFGNQDVQRLLRAGALQAKLTVNQPGDRYEQEADRVAEQVMRMESTEESATPAPAGSIQRKCAECEEEEKKVQRQAMDETEEQAVEEAPEEAIGEKEEETEGDESGMPKREAGSAAAGATGVDIPHGPGQPLEAGARGFLEGAMGHDFGGVRVHADGAAARSAQGLRAHAYTVGRDVYFNEGAYRPASSEGRKLLAHELTHVVQQTGGSQTPGVQRKCPQGKQSSQGYAIGFHDSQPVGAGFKSHGCVRVGCSVAEKINKNTWSGVSKINVT